MKTKKQKLFAAVVVLLVIGFAFANVITGKRVVPVKDAGRSGYRAVEGYGLPEGVEVLKPTAEGPARPHQVLKASPVEVRLHEHPLEHGANYDLPVRQWEREQVAQYKQWLIDEGWVNPDGSQKYVPGHVIVQFKNEVRSMVQPDLSEATPAFGIPSVDAINATYNAQSLERVIKPEAIELGTEALVMKHGLDLIYTITFDDDANVEEIANAFLNDPSISEASPDWMSYPCNIPQHAQPDDPYWDSTSWSYEDMKCLEAWVLETGNSSVEVAHIALGPDALNGAGPNTAHLDLDLNYSGTYGGSISGGQTNHSTACVAMMSAENNNTYGQCGVAGGWGTTPGCDYTYYGMPNSVAGQIAAYTWVGNRGCIAANVSFGGGYPGAGVEAAVNYAWDNDCIITASAGNEYYPDISFPAYFGNCMAIGGTQHGTSGYGNENIYTHGVWVELLAPSGTFAIPYDGMAWGTSFSSPKVAGLIGLMKSEHSGWTVEQLRAYASETGDWIDYIPGNDADRTGLLGGGAANAYEALKVYDKNVSLNRLWAPCVKWYWDSTIVSLGKYIDPQVVVQNRGINRESFMVTLEIDTAGGGNVYTSTQFVEGLADRTDKTNKGEVVTFDTWYSGDVSTDTAVYTFTAYTSLAGDQNTENDTVSETVYVLSGGGGAGVLDTLMYDTDAPTWYYSDSNTYWAVQMEPESPCSVMAIYFYAYDPYGSHGNYEIYTWSDNGSGLPLDPADYGPQIYTVNPGMQAVDLDTHQYYTGVFHLGFWCAASFPLAQGPVVITDNGPGSNHSELKLPGGSWQEYGTRNFIIRAIVLYPGLHDDDIACWGVIAPDEHEIYGVPLLPRAIFKNIGSLSQSNFPVTMNISIKNGSQVYTSTKTITQTLDTYDVDTVDFDGWAPNTNDTVFNMECYHSLAGDDATGNDTIKYAVLVSQVDTLVYDNNDSRWYWSGGDRTYNHAVTFSPTMPCSVIGMTYELLCRPSPSATACTLIAWTAVNDTPLVRQWGQEDATPEYGWNSYTFTPAQKLNRPNAEPFSLGYWVPYSDVTDSVYPLFDEQPVSWHSYMRGGGSGWTPTSDIFGDGLNLMIRAIVRYTAGAYAHDVGALTINNPPPYDYVYPLRAVTPVATVINYGTNSETFDVVFRIDSVGGTEYADTQSVTVPVATSKQVSFVPWSPQVVDMDYVMYAKTTLGTDQNTANDQTSGAIYCRTIDIISYNEQTWGSLGIYGDEYPYHAVRFTPARPCTVWGALINIWSNVDNNTNPCSLFLWEDTLDHPAMTTIDYDTFTMHGVGADSAGYIYRIRIDFGDSAAPQTYETDEDFWVGVFADPVTNADADTALIAFSDVYSYSNIDGRSLTDTVGRPNDRWYAITWVSSTDTSQADWQIKALVKYLEFPGDAPLAPDIRVSKSGNNARVWWNSVTTDVSDNPTECDHYTLYEDASYNFTPGDDYFLAGTADTFYNHTNALISSVHNYLAYSFNIYGTKSNVCSNMGFVLSKFFNENPAKTDKNWVSLPYHTDYDDVSDLVADLSPAGDPLVKITNLTDNQTYESWLWDPDFYEWYGDNFSITPGRAYEMITTTDTSLVIVGSNEPHGLITLNENPTKTDKNWVSIPYNAVYSTISDVTAEYAAGGDPLVKCTNLTDNQTYESWLWDPDFWEWYGDDFAITPGRGYEFATTVDTTWDPTEYSNEAAKAMIARRGAARATAEVVLGTATETERAPAFAEKKADLDLAGAVVQSVGRDIAHVSHVVRTHIELDECEGLVFTAYRPDAPHDVLTEQLVGSGVAYKDGLGAVWFDVGNFATPWQHGDEVMLIIEATKEGRGYFTFVAVKLDGTVDVQDLKTVSLTAIPEPTIENGVAYWNELDNDDIIGYSLYDNDTRINSEMITAAGYAVAGEVSLKLVFTGGYETVSGSQGFEDARPTAFAFSIRPNPFAERATISYALPKAQNVSVEVYDVTGRQVTTLASGAHEAGFYQVSWAGDDALGRQAATGVYFIKMITDEYQSQHKVIFVR